MKQHVARWEVWDPSLGAERRISAADGTVVSARGRGVLILEGPHTAWSHYGSAVETLLAATGASTFLVYSPWRTWRAIDWPSRLGRSFPEAYIREASGVLLASGLDRHGVVERWWDSMQDLGRSAGLWALGSSASTEELTGQVQRLAQIDNSPISLMAAAIDYLGCALCVDDGLDMVLCHQIPSAQLAAADLVRALDAVPGRTG
jgi:hypothetical protein